METRMDRRASWNAGLSRTRRIHGNVAVMVNMKRIAVLITLIGLSSCGEWNSYALVNPDTGKETACAVPWGPSLSSEDIQRLHQCIAACEARGYYLKSPASVPPPVPWVAGAMPPSIPLACQP